MDFKITKGHYKLRCVSINIYIYNNQKDQYDG